MTDVINNNAVPTEELKVPPVAPPDVSGDQGVEDFNDPLGTPADVLGSTNPTAMIDSDVAQQAADTYNLASLGNVDHVSVASVIRQHTTEDVGASDVSALLKHIRGEDHDVQQQLITAAITNHRVPVEQRIALAKQYGGLAGVDLNAITRQAMHNLNILENSGDTPEAQDDREKGAIAAERLPKNIQVDTPMPTKIGDVRSTYEHTLNEAYTESRDNAGVTDFLGSLLPFRFQLPVMKIYNALGLDEGAVNKSGHLLMGNALKSIREYVDGQDYKGKQESLDTILRILKPNAGVWSNGNDLVTSHVLEEVFYQDLFKQEHGNTGGLSAAHIVGNLLPSAGAQKAINNFMGGHDVTGTQVIDNVTSLLDLVGIGSLARSTLKLGTKWLPKSLMRMREVAPDTATRTAVDAMVDPSMAARLGVKPEEVLAASLPASHKAIQEGGVNGLSEVIARQLDIRERLLRISGRTNMTADERAAAFDEIKQMYGDIAAKPDSTLHLNESVINNTPAGVTIDAMFGRTKSKPFSSYAQAAWANRAEIERTFGADAKPEIVWRNPETKLLEPVPKSVKPFEKGEFFLRARDERSYESAPTVYHSLVLGDKDVANLRFAPSLWKHLRGVTNLMSKDVADNLRLTARQRTEWNKLTAGLTSDVSSLPASESRKLAQALKDGEGVAATTGSGKIYSPTELRQMGLSEAGQRAYYAYRNATDIMYGVVNAQVRNRMLRDGVVDIHSPTGRVGFGQPRTLAQAGHDIGESKSLSAFDPSTGKYVQLDHSALEALYKDGNVVARLESPLLGRGEAEATHVIVDAKAGVKQLGLPRQVVTKVEGYYPHMWNGNYVVYGTTRAGNRYALGLATNEADARAVVARMKNVNATRKAAGKTSRFTDIGYDFDRSLSSDMARRGKVMEDVYTNMGGPVYGARNGGDMRNFSKASGDLMVDPIEAMQRGMEIVGAQVTKQDTARYMRQKLYNYARQEGILRDPRTIPVTSDDLVFIAGKREAYNKAKAYMDSIDLLLNTRDAVDEAVSKFFLGASDMVSRYLGNTSAGRAISSKLATKAARGADPMAGVMGLVHRITIASAPVAQFALQASQSLMMLGVAPVQYIKAVGQTGLVGTLVGLRSAALHGSMRGNTAAEFAKKADGIARTLGMSKDELIKVVDTIMDNGLVSSVSYHTQMRNAIRSAAEERMLANTRGLNRPILGTIGRAARAIDANTFGRLSKLGFEGGEDINQIATFLTLYNRDKAKGIADLANPDYVKRLVGSTAELTGDMIPETGFTYQRGWFKAAMQFVSFQHKMMLLMMPKGMGGAKSLTGAEKAGMVFAQFLLFGRRGAAHMDAIYRLVDSKIREQAKDENDPMYAAWNDPSTRAVMDGLVFDTAGNYVLKELFGDHPTFSLSERFAPGGGSEFVMDRLTAIGTNPTQAIFGLAGDKMSKLYHYIRRVGDISLANVREMDDVPLDERMNELAKEGGAQLFSTYNRLLATQAAARLDGWLSSGGKLTEGFSGQLEGVLYTQFGVTTKDRQSLYTAMDKFREEEMHNPLARQKNLDDMVNQYYKDLLTSSVRFDKEATSDAVWSQLMDKWVRERGVLFSVLDPQDAEYINQKVGEKIQKAVSHPQDSAEATLVERVTSDIRNGRFGKEGPDAAAYLNEAEFVRKNPRLHEIVRQAWEDANTDDYMERK